MNRLYDAIIRFSFAIVIPVALFFFASTSHFQVKRQLQIETFKSKMNQKLSLLFDYNKDSVFFHAILQKNFSLADKSKSPKAALKNTIKRFKNKFGSNINFIIWNKRGKLNSELSYITNYKYVLKLILNAITRLSKEPNTKKTNNFIVSKIKLLRKILGKFLMPAQMYKPFEKGYLGKCLVTETTPDKGLLWYQAYNNFSLVCFLSRDILTKNIASDLLANRFNRQSKDIKLASYDLIKDKFHGISGLKESLKRELRIATEQYKQASSPFRETKSLILLFKQPSEKLLVFSYLVKHNNITNVSTNRAFFISKCIVILLILFYILYCYRLKHKNQSILVKQKLILLFLFINLIGLFTIIAASYKFFDYKRLAMIDDIQKESFQKLKKINLKYESERNAIASSLNNFVDSKNNIYKDKEWSKKSLNQLKKIVKKHLPSESVIVKANGKMIVFCSNRKVRVSLKSFREFMLIVLPFINNVPINEDMQNNPFRNLKNATLLTHILRDLNHFHLTKFVVKTRWIYYKLLGDSSNYHNWGILSIGWSIDEMQRFFFNSSIDKLNESLLPRKLFVMTKDKELIFPKSSRINKKIKSFLHNALYQSKMQNNNLEVNNKNYIATAITENSLLKCSMLILYPRNLIEKQVFRLKLYTFSIILLSSLLLIFTGWTFSKSLISPIQSLESGVNRIRTGNFKKIIQNPSSDELGDLELLLNSTMTNMEMLSLGTSVQKNLLPDRHYSKGKLELYADSEFMTKMGGDYFDYFDKDSDHLTILFGDVAGHGIPAGMVMGMVKAIFTDSSLNPGSPLEILKKINHVLVGLKKKKWRGAMTCQCIELNCTTGQFKFANSGHCYPLIVSKARNETKLIQLIGLPLGNRMSKKAKEISEKLSSGEIMLLYSDGIVESTNNQGEQLGFNRFQKLVLDSWSDNVRIYWKNIYQKYKEWAAEQDDDITFMIVKINNEK